MKKGLATLLVIVVLFVTVFASSDTFTLVRSEYPIYINGIAFDTGDLPPLNYEGNTYLPLRKVAEATGNDVDFIDNQIILNNSSDIYYALKYELYLYTQLAEMYTEAAYLTESLNTFFTSLSNSYPDYPLQRIAAYPAMIESTQGIMEIADQYGLDYQLVNRRTTEFTYNMNELLSSDLYYKDRGEIICNGGFANDFYFHINNLKTITKNLQIMSNMNPATTSATESSLFYDLADENLLLTDENSTNCFNSVKAISDLL